MITVLTNVKCEIGKPAFTLTHNRVIEVVTVVGYIIHHKSDPKNSFVLYHCNHYNNKYILRSDEVFPTKEELLASL